MRTVKFQVQRISFSIIIQKGANGAVEHLGDNRTGEGEGDDESIKVDLKNVPAHIERICFTITIYDGEGRSQNFGQVSNSFVRILDEEKECRVNSLRFRRRFLY